MPFPSCRSRFCVDQWIADAKLRYVIGETAVLCAAALSHLLLWCTALSQIVRGRARRTLVSNGDARRERPRPCREVRSDLAVDMRGRLLCFRRQIVFHRARHTQGRLDVTNRAAGSDPHGCPAAYAGSTAGFE